MVPAAFRSAYETHLEERGKPELKELRQKERPGVTVTAFAIASDEHLRFRLWLGLQS